jgi:hypothetical protein
MQNASAAFMEQWNKQFSANFKQTTATATKEALDQLYTGGGAAATQAVLDAGETVKTIKELWDGYYQSRAEQEQALHDNIKAIETESFDHLTELLIRGGDTWRDYAAVAISAIRDIIREQQAFDKSSGGSGALLSAISAVGSSIFGGGMTTLNPIGEVSPSQIPINIPARATGGPVTAGTLYQVNENGKEYFRPDTNGEIIPMGGNGGWRGKSDGEPARVQVDVSMSPLLIGAIVQQASSKAEANVMARMRNRGRSL